jgi:hypothetical protein
MNTFILAYAFFILLIVQLYIAPTTDLRLIRDKSTSANVTEITETPEYLSETGNTNELERLKFSDNFHGLLGPKSGTSDLQPFRIYYQSTIDPRQHDLQALIVSSITKLKVTTDGAFEPVPDQEEIELRKLVFLEAGLNKYIRDLETPSEDDLPRIEQLHIQATGRISSLRDLDAAYTSTFSQTDAVEDGFPVSIFGSLELLDLKQLVGDTVLSEADATGIALCIFHNGGVVRFPITPETLDFLENCKDFVTLENIWQWGLTRALGTLNRDLEDRIVPYNTLLITSLLPTFLFYFVVLMMAVATLVFSYILRGARVCKPYFLRSPIAIASFIVAVPLKLLGWL